MATQNKKIALTITANTRQLRQDMRRATGEVKGFERQVMGLGARMRAMRMRFQSQGIFGRGGGMLRGAAGFAGVFGFAQMIQGAKEGNAALTDIAITGNLTNREMQALKKTMYEVSNNTAKSTTELGQFVATVTTMTGDAKGAHAALADMAEVMVATGASGEALAGTYVKLTTTMGLMPKQAREAFNVLRSQEKLGSITMANIAANFGKVLGPAGVFGAEAKGIKGVKTLGGLFQIAQRGFAVGQEGQAATSAGAFLGFLGRRAAKVKKVFGVEVFDKAGKARDLPTVLEELGIAFGKKKEAFRTKGALIFGRAGIRTAQQLQVAMAGGAGSKVGSFASFNELVRNAGGTDVIKADAARRRQSAAYQFDSSLNILKNTLKKPMAELFKSLAAGLKEWGPSLTRTLKFLIENSSALLKMWLGYKGMTFFKNLMAPMGGGGGMGGVAGAIMGPGGQLIAAGGAGANRPGGFYAGAGGGWRGVGAQREIIGGGAWVNAGRSGGMIQENGWGSIGGRNVGTGWRARMGQRMRGYGNRMAAGYAGGIANYGGGVMGGVGMAAGAAGMMGMFGDQSKGVFGSTGASLAQMGMMYGGPVTKAISGAVMIVNDASIDVKNAREGKDSRLAAYAKSKAFTMGGSSANLSKVASGAMAEYRRLTGIDTAIGNSYGTWRGYEARNRANALIGQFGGFMGAGGVMGISPEQRMLLADKHGSKGLKTMQGKVGSSLAEARSFAAAALRVQNQPVTEENLMRDTQYAKLKDLYKALDKLILDIVSGKKINLIMPVGTTPGQRVENNATVSQTFGSTAGMTSEYG